jgi:catechol 2,3-dioxygenase-like lactoylglutathione lyase family enzyme
MIQGMNHFTITAEEPQKTLDFYCGLLGLVEGPRPPFDFPGAWLYAPGGGEAILHLVFGRPLPAQRTGVIDHIAFSAQGLAAVKTRLEAAGQRIDLRRVPGSGVWQLFTWDPNGARVEMDFAAEESDH